VVQVLHVRRALGEGRLVVPLEADVEDVGDAEPDDLLELRGRQRVVVGVQVAADRELRRHEVQVGRLGGRERVHERFLQHVWVAPVDHPACARARRRGGGNLAGR
jgi:hypothetical protein